MLADGPRMLIGRQIIAEYVEFYDFDVSKPARAKRIAVFGSGKKKPASVARSRLD